MIRALDLMGQALFMLDDTLNAERFLLRALQTDPGYAPAHLHLGQVYLLEGEARARPPTARYRPRIVTRHTDRRPGPTPAPTLFSLDPDMRYSHLLAILIVIGLALAACQALPSVENAAPGSVLFQDDFSTTSGGWKLSQDRSGVTEYAGGGLRVVINAPTADYFTVPGLTLGDVRVEVDAAKTHGSDSSDFGLICRYKDADNFYFMKITSDGYYVIGKFKVVI